MGWIPSRSKWAVAVLASVALLAGRGQGAWGQEEPQEKPATKRERVIPNDGHLAHGGAYMGRDIAEVMSYLGADWLLRETRAVEEEPERMLRALQIKPGEVVADVGAGVGFHSLLMSRMVGPKGRVLATDIQPQMLRMMRQRIKLARVTNVTPILCTQTDPKLPESAVDLILMVDVYHECSEPEATLAGLYKALKPGGRLVLVEFRAEDPDVPIKPEHKMSVAQVRRELEPAGFHFKELLDFLPWQHILIFEKPASVEGEKPEIGEKAEKEGTAEPSAAPRS